MGLPPDYHMHTPLCRHAIGHPVEYAAKASALGLTEIGFSDHSPMPLDDFDDWRMRLGDLDTYVAQVQEARDRHPGMMIRLALEVDYFPGQEPWISDLAKRHSWDYLIGSVHYVSETWAIDNPNMVDTWRSRDPMEVWTLYFERLTQAARSGLFDIIGHADLCKRFCYYPTADCTGLYTRFLSAAKDANVAIELNTAGLRKDCKEIYPNPLLLQLASRMEVPITFGSDAHQPGEVGMNFVEAIGLARSAGYARSRRFRLREYQDLPF